MLDNYYAFIMAGGGGTRLWPVSRHTRPKQMIRLGGDRTLFQLAVDRIEAVFPPQRTYVVTVAEQAEALKKQCPGIPPENFLIEPMPRGTASVVGLAAAALYRRNPQAVMSILAADHLIQNVSYFQEILSHAYQVAQDGYLVTLGIRPTFPSSGYGYIQRGESLEGYAHPAYRVVKFKEKPDEAAARRLIEQGDHDWNSGMFVWRADRIWQEIHALMPELAEKLDRIADAWHEEQPYGVIQSEWPSIRTETIDYGIMERAGRVAVLPAADLGWNDVGSWESLFEVFQTDEQGNVSLDCRHISLDTERSLIVSDETGRLIVTMGVSDLIVVDTPNALLVCSRDSAQRVREVVNLLKQKKEAQFL